MERKNLIGSALTVRGRSGRSNRAASHRGIRLAPLLLVAVMLAAVAVLAVTSNPSQTAQAQNYGNVVCVSPPAASCPTYEDDPLPAEITLLSATLTVGTLTVGTSTFYGWNDSDNYTGASLTDEDFSFGGKTYNLDQVYLQQGGLILSFNMGDAGDIATQATRDKLTLHVGSDSFELGEGTLAGNQHAIVWTTGLTWAAGDSITLKITGPPPPNAYGYRTIWNALMTVSVDSVSTYAGYSDNTNEGQMTNNTILPTRTDIGVIINEFRYPWNGYAIDILEVQGTKINLTFYTGSYPSEDEVAAWTLILDGKELPFAAATIAHATTPWIWNFTYSPTWTHGQQVSVSIRTTYEVQNRYGQVALKAIRTTRVGDNGNIVYGKTHHTYPRGTSRFGFGDSWELQRLRVTTDKTGDTDPVWIMATFRAPNTRTGHQGWWEGEFDDFHTLFIRWIYHEGGIGKGAATYTLPLKAAAEEGGIQKSRSGRDITFTWVRTYKEFERRHLDLANHSFIFADFLTTPQPATARSTVNTQNNGNQHRLYTPGPTVTTAEFTSNPGADQVTAQGRSSRLPSPSTRP